MDSFSSLIGGIVLLFIALDAASLILTGKARFFRWVGQWVGQQIKKAATAIWQWFWRMVWQGIRYLARMIWQGVRAFFRWLFGFFGRRQQTQGGDP